MFTDEITTIRHRVFFLQNEIRLSVQRMQIAIQEGRGVTYEATSAVETIWTYEGELTILTPCLAYVEELDVELTEAEVRDEVAKSVQNCFRIWSSTNDRGSHGSTSMVANAQAAAAATGERKGIGLLVQTFGLTLTVDRFAF